MHIEDELVIVDDPITLDPEGERKAPPAKRQDEISPDAVESLQAQLAALKAERDAERREREAERQRREAQATRERRQREREWGGRIGGVVNAVAGGAMGYAADMHGQIQGARQSRALANRTLGNAVRNAGGSTDETPLARYEPNIDRLVRGGVTPKGDRRQFLSSAHARTPAHAAAASTLRAGAPMVCAR